MSRQVTLKISGMRCEGCAGSVEKALKGVSGVSSASIDLKGGKATVEYDPASASEEDLAEAVRKAGFGVNQVFR